MTNTELASASKVMLGTTEATAMYIGDTLIWKAGPLPVGYTQLEYIESTSSGRQYINLGIKLYQVKNTDYDIAIKFKMSGRGGDNENQPALFCCQDPNNSPWPGTFIRMDLTKNTNVMGRYIGGTAKDNVLGSQNELIELPVQTPPDKNVKNLNNNNSTHMYGTALFCSFSNTSDSPYRFATGTIYYFKLFVEGVLVRDMVPCIDPNNVVGMYDVVNNVFYSSPNGAAFVAGPTV